MVVGLNINHQNPVIGIPPIKNADHPVEAIQNHEKQIIPLITDGNFKAKFLTKDEAEAVIVSSDYLKNLSEFDCQLRVNKNYSNNWKADFCEYYLAQTREWSNNEIAILNDMLVRVRAKLAAYDITLPAEINFIKSTMHEELPGTGGYCLNETIVLPGIPSEGLLIHELFHIHSQVDPQNRGKLYKLIGFTSCNNIDLPETFAEKRVLNPDSLFLNAYTEVMYRGKAFKAVPFDFHENNRQTPSGGSHFLPHVFHKFVAVEEKNNRFVPLLNENQDPVVFDFNQCDYEARELNTSYKDSPEEIMADNFKYMVQKTPVESPELIEKMKGLFKKTVLAPQAVDIRPDPIVVPQIPVLPQPPKVVEPPKMVEPPKDVQRPVVVVVQIPKTVEPPKVVQLPKKVEPPKVLQPKKQVVQPVIPLKINEPYNKPSFFKRICNVIKASLMCLKNFFKHLFSVE